MSVRRVSVEDEPIDSVLRQYTPVEKRILLVKFMHKGMWRRSCARRYYYCYVPVLLNIVLLTYANEVSTDG